MKKYVICAENGSLWNASSKARQDAEKIACANGFAPFPFVGEKSAQGRLGAALRAVRCALGNWGRLARQVPPGALVLVQYPLYPQKSVLLASWMLGLLRRRRIRFVALIHDLNSARDMFGWAAQYSDRKFLKKFDKVICHNDAMCAWLLQRGFAKAAVIPLGLFDYLSDASPLSHTAEEGITVAGNLEPVKCGYLPELERLLEGRTPLHLYGNGAAGRATACWHGAFPPEQLPGVLQGGFGLVWDGPSAEGCQGNMGGYLRLNTPHKTSLYLAAGLPLIVWREAAIAPLVLRYGLGLTVASLWEIPNRLAALTPDDYARMRRNASAAGERLRAGGSLSAALAKAEQTAG